MDNTYTLDNTQEQGGPIDPYLTSISWDTPAAYGGQEDSADYDDLIRLIDFDVNGQDNLNPDFTSMFDTTPEYDQDPPVDTASRPTLAPRPTLASPHMLASPPMSVPQAQGGSSGNPMQSYQGVIRNESHYQSVKAQGLAASNAGGNNQCPDFPHTEDEQRQLVKELFDSIVNTDDVLDKPAKNNQPAQAVRKFRDGSYPDADIELKCWEILLGCRAAAMGVRLVENQPRGRKDAYTGFRDRFQKVVEGCRISKALCKQIMDPPFISRLVTAPASEIQMKYTNKKLNAERDIQNEIGRNAVRRGIKLDDLDQIAKVDKGPAYPTPEPTSPWSPGMTITPDLNTSFRAQQSLGKRKTMDEDLGGEGGEALGSPAKRSRPSPESLTCSPSDVFGVPTPPMYGNRPPQAPDNNLDRDAQLMANYKAAICDLLNVPREYGNRYELGQLRIYARAYSQEYRERVWFIDRYTGVGCALFLDNQIHCGHFATEFPAFLDLATARGDLLNGDLNLGAPHGLGYPPQTDHVVRQALGIVPNPFGPCHNLYI